MKYMTKIKNLTLLLLLLCMSFITLQSQVVVKIKPARPKVLVVKPADPRPGYLWRTGYWRWHKNKHQYIWVKASWVKENPGHHWTAGYWKKNSHGHVWVAGHWKKGKKKNKVRRKAKRRQ